MKKCTENDCERDVRGLYFLSEQRLMQVST